MSSIPKRYQNFHDKLPLFMQIPIPIPDPRPRGVQSLGSLSVAYSVRFDKETLERIDVRSKQLGITRGEYIRWCTTKMLDAIDNELKPKREKHDSTTGSTDTT